MMREQPLVDRLVRHLGLADALGIVVSLVAVVYLPSLADPASYPKLLVLAAGGLALLPAVVSRWTLPTRPTGSALWLCGAGAALVAWSMIATLASDAPWQVRLFGWWLRADGLLAIIGAGVLLLGAATLAGPEVRRCASWLSAGAVVAALLTVPQLLGIPFLTVARVDISSTFGQINFAAGYFAVMAVMTAGLALASSRPFPRYGWAAAAALMAFIALKTTSLQGPMALGVGLLALLVAWALASRGTRRRLAIGLTSGAAVLALALGSLGMLSRGPLAFVGQDTNTIWRFAVWGAGWDTMNAHPILGIGTGNFARHISENRSLASVVVTGEAMRPSAVHSIPLQFGIVGGWPALLLWIAIFLGAMALLLVRLARRPVIAPWLAAGIAGALAAYVAQAVVSIDAPPILATGWVVAGLAIAALREGAPPGASGAATGPRGSRTEPRIQGRPGAMILPGALLALVGGALVWWQLDTAQRAAEVQTAPDVLATLTDPAVPCPLRVQLANSFLPGQKIEIVKPVMEQAAAVDPRCPPMMTLLAQMALEASDPALADQATSAAIALDPNATAAWQLRAQFLQATGDQAVAAEAASHAEELAVAISAGEPTAAPVDATTDPSTP